VEVFRGLQLGSIILLSKPENLKHLGQIQWRT